MSDPAAPLSPAPPPSTPTAPGPIDLKLLQQVCSIPTAPFFEDRIIHFLREFVAARPALRLDQDRHGNQFITLPGDSTQPRWVFTAHMDHPGFVARRTIDGHSVEADFYGGVQTGFFAGAKVRFFEGNREITGTIVTTSARIDDQPDRVTQCLLLTEAPVAVGTLGMFDQGEGRFEAGKFLCRCCDDLAGAAACLEMLDHLIAAAPPSPVCVLLTRGEEEGFIGCLAVCQDRQLLRDDDRVIAIECSAQQTFAPQGQGVIIRVGDRTSIFHSGLTYFLTQQAEALRKIDDAFKHQRALMPGGTCEATVYDINGFIAASLCVALGNYHNMDKTSGNIGPEFVDVADWQNMVKLFEQLAKTGHEFELGHSALKAKLAPRFEKFRPLLARPV